MPNEILQINKRSNHFSIKKKKKKKKYISYNGRYGLINDYNLTLNQSFIYYII